MKSTIRDKKEKENLINKTNSGNKNITINSNKESKVVSPKKENAKESQSSLSNNTEDSTKTKRAKLKPIKVKRSLNDILITDDPCVLIINYKGREVSSMPLEINVPNESEEPKNEIENKNKKEEEMNIFALEEHEQLLLTELKKLLNKKDLTDEIKCNIKSLYIEVQKFYLEIKNDIKENFPTTQELLKLYSSKESDKAERELIRKKFYFYKLLKEQLNDLHISTIASYRMECLKSMYTWYNKHKKILFNENTSENLNYNFENVPLKSIGTITDHTDKRKESEYVKQNECIHNTTNETQMEEHKKEKEEERRNKIEIDEQEIQSEPLEKKSSSKYDVILSEYIKEKFTSNDNSKCKEESYDTMQNELSDYLLPNNLINVTSPKEISTIVDIKTVENYEVEKKEKEEEEPNSLFNLNESTIEKIDDICQIPIDTKIEELEAEINRQKLLIKEKEIEIINSPIGLKFKDIFGNFQDIDLNK